MNTRTRIFIIPSILVSMVLHYIDYLPLILTVTWIHLLAVISPGPDFIMIIKNALLYSRKTGIWTAVWLGLGIAVHILYCITGLAFIISQSILVFNIIKLLGASYLIYLGVKSIFSRSSKIETQIVQTRTEISRWKAIKIWFLTNILNPKATLFFLSLFTLVISPETPSWVLMTLSIIMIVNTILWFSVVATLFSHKRIRGVFEHFQGIFNKILGSLLVGLWIKVALSHK